MEVQAMGPQAGMVDELATVAELYAAHAVRMRRLVHLHVTAPDAVVEDACQVAWLRLVRHRARIRRQTATQWLLRVAINEARRAISRAERDVSLDELEVDARPLQTAPDLVDALAGDRDRLRAVVALPERQRRLLWLQAIGLSHAEMAGVTGDSPRTVDRQLTRARSRLAAVDSPTPASTISAPASRACLAPGRRSG